jgi:hypothetical protein
MRALTATVSCQHTLTLSSWIVCTLTQPCQNVIDGINEFDGTDAMYFHGGEYKPQTPNPKPKPETHVFVITSPAGHPQTLHLTP